MPGFRGREAAITACPERFLGKQYYEALEKTTAGDVAMNERQVKMVNRLWDGFEGKLTTAKWAKIRKS